MAHHHFSDRSKIKSAFFINLAFTCIELIGGLYTNSIAILSDALHDLGDSLSLGTAWYFEHLSKRDRDHDYSYGYRRFSLLGAVINSMVLVLGSAFILYNAIPRLFNPVMPDAEGMIYFAMGGILANGFAAWKLHGGSSINERAVYLHLLEDVLGWTATLIGAVIIYFQALPIIDPILSIGIALFILYNVYGNFNKAIRVFLQATPEKIDPEEISRLLNQIPEVLETHDCHIWSMDGQYHILSIHLVVAKQLNMSQLAEIKIQVKQLLRDQKINHMTIEFEFAEENCDQILPAMASKTISPSHKQ